MLIIDVSEAKAQLSALIDKALVGEVVITAKTGKRVVKLIRYRRREKRRRPGALKGKIKSATTTKTGDIGQDPGRGRGHALLVIADLFRRATQRYCRRFWNTKFINLSNEKCQNREKTKCRIPHL